MKLLFFSPHTLLDSSSGAALCVSTLLSELVKLGHTCIAVTGSVTDAKNALFAQVREGKASNSITVQNGRADVPVRKVDFNGVMNVVAGDGAAVHELRAVEDVVLRRLFLDGFAQIDPDVVMTYGGFVSNYYAGQYAMAQGRRAVLYVASETYAEKHAHQFSHVNMVHTVSEALRDRLNTVSDLPKVATQTFVRREDVVCARRTPEFVTFMNPVPDKGLKIAAGLVRECHRRQKPYKFLFVEGRGTREMLFTASPDLKGLNNLFIADNTADVRQIYERTAVCLYPSVWFESAGRVPIECNANGIPVLASNRGGIPEMLDGAGFLFDIPAESQRNYNGEVPVAYLEQWITTLDRLHAEPAFMADAMRRAREADARYDIARMARKFADAMSTP